MTKTKQEKISRARYEAVRFIARCDELLERHARDEHFRRYMEITGFKETAAVKRASLDLSRALSELRRVEGGQ
jgi:hypothetical protein